MKIVKFGDRVRTHSTIMINSSGEHEEILTYHPHGSQFIDYFRKNEPFQRLHKKGNFYLIAGAPYPCSFPLIVTALESSDLVYIELNQHEVLPTLIDLCLAYGRKPYIQGFNRMFKSDCKRSKKPLIDVLGKKSVIISHTNASNLDAVIGDKTKSSLTAFVCSDRSIPIAARNYEHFQTLFIMPDGDSKSAVNLSRSVIKDHYNHLDLIFYPRFKEMIIGGLIKKNGIDTVMTQYDNLGIVASVKEIMSGYYTPSKDAVFCLQTLFDSSVSTKITTNHLKNVVILPVSVDM